MFFLFFHDGILLNEVRGLWWRANYDNHVITETERLELGHILRVLPFFCLLEKLKKEQKLLRKFLCRGWAKSSHSHILINQEVLLHSTKRAMLNIVKKLLFTYEKHRNIIQIILIVIARKFKWTLNKGSQY